MSRSTVPDRHYGLMLSSLAPARRRLVFVLLALLAALVVAVGIVAVAGHHSTSTPAAQVDQTRPGPVLLVPGYGGSVSSLQPLAARLRQAGKDATIVSLPDNAEGDLTAQAKVLAQAASNALSRTKAASVDVVGYSAGGVVARIWLKDLGGAAVVRRLVTLGSPQHGTALAELGSLVQGECPTACQQLVPTSDVLSGLNTAPELPTGPAVISLWTSKDQVVLPPDSAVLQGALNIQLQQICSDSTTNHTQLPTDALVEGLVVAELRTTPPTTYGPADCQRLRATS